jgi:hypothetical protein
MDRFFVDEVQDKQGRFMAFGVMDRENPDDIVAEFTERGDAETEAGLCNQCPDDYDVERRFCLGIPLEVRA